MLPIFSFVYHEMSFFISNVLFLHWMIRLTAKKKMWFISSVLIFYPIDFFPKLKAKSLDLNVIILIWLKNPTHFWCFYSSPTTSEVWSTCGWLKHKIDLSACVTWFWRRNFSTWRCSLWEFRVEFTLKIWTVCLFPSLLCWAYINANFH